MGFLRIWDFQYMGFLRIWDFLLHGFSLFFLRPGSTVKLYFSVPVVLYWLRLWSNAKNPGSASGLMPKFWLRLRLQNLAAFQHFRI